MHQITLANLILDPSGIPGGGTQLLWRTQGRACWQADGAQAPALRFEGELDLMSYFNALPLEKWRRYTQLDNVYAELVLDAAVPLQVRRAYAHDSGRVVSVQQANLKTARAADGLGENAWQADSAGYGQFAGLPAQPPFDQPLPAACCPAPDGFVRYVVPIPLDEATLAGLALLPEPGTAARLRSARFFTCADEGRVRDVRIALCTTTYCNEDYILPNIHAVMQQVLGSKAPIAHNFHLFVVDNGRSLDAETLAQAGFKAREGRGGRLHLGSGVTVCPNPNVGGSGGFARGMIEALDADGTDEAYTHVLLMDDDVVFMPESFHRTHALLQLAAGPYRDAFVNGAMMKLQEPTCMFEDVAHTRPGGSYGPYKPKRDVSGIPALVANEATPIEGKRSYGAWWYSCIPIEAIRTHGLPLPLFVRCDDVEYGVRCQATYMALSGICVWHSQFNGRFRASVDLYQYGRNTLVITACDKHASQTYFMAKYWRNLQVYLRFMNYSAAELWLDALEDYLEGPAFLAAVDGAQLMRDNAAKNEKLVPLDQLDPAVVEQLDIQRGWLGHDDLVQSVPSKILDAVPHDRHFLPDFLLDDTPGFVDYSGSLSPWTATAMRRTLVALDATGENGAIRTVDRARHKQLLQRYTHLMDRYVRENPALLDEYQAAMPYLTSREFWEEYLEL